MEGLLAPEVKEEITATLEVLQTFHISKVGTIAGCIVREGKIKRGNKVRVIRDGIVIKTAELASLKHVKDDIKEAGVNTECGFLQAIHCRSYSEAVLQAACSRSFSCSGLLSFVHDKLLDAYMDRCANDGNSGAG